MSGNNNKPKVINVKLLCPFLSKVTQMVTCDDERIDLGLVAGAFGLDPTTVRLNGYFIGRGVDQVASSVTWKSLISFFSSKGLSNGRDQRDAIVVTGKLCKVGYKRGHDSQDFENGIGKVMDGENACNSKGIQQEAVNLIKNKKLKENNYSEGEILNGLRSKRKQLLDDVNLFKKLKINEDKSDFHDKVDDSGNIPRSQFTCSYASKNLKWIREDEAIVTANYKRIR